LAYAKQYSIDHKEERKARKHEYDKINRDRNREYYVVWYKKNGRNRADNYLEKILEWNETFPRRKAMHRKLYRAIKAGKVTRPEICPNCGRSAKIQAHHVNYEHFMNFVWLCASCHKREHNDNKA